MPDKDKEWQSWFMGINKKLFNFVYEGEKRRFFLIDHLITIFLNGNWTKYSKQPDLLCSLNDVVIKCCYILFNIYLSSSSQLSLIVSEVDQQQ